jgi:hypothetical protein
MAFLPDYWWPTDELTVITRETSQLLRRYGSASAHVIAPAPAVVGDPSATDADGNPAPIFPYVGSGIVSSPIPVRPSEFKPYYTVQVSLWPVSGTVRLELWDVTDCANVIFWPPRESDLRASTSEVGTWVDNFAVAPGEDFFHGVTYGHTTTHFQIALVADVPDTEFYLDAAMLTNEAAGMPTFVEGKAANLLILSANDEFGIRGQPLSEYSLSVLDLNRKDATIWPEEELTLGANGRLKVDEQLLDVKPRMMGLRQNLTEEMDSRVTLESEEETLTRQLAMTNRRRRNLRISNPEQTNRPANVQGIKAVITS